MDPKRLPKYLTMKDFRENIVNWSDQKIRRKIKEEGLPAMQEDNGRWLFPTQDVIEWFKRRVAKTA